MRRQYALAVAIAFATIGLLGVSTRNSMADPLPTGPNSEATGVERQPAKGQGEVADLHRVPNILNMVRENAADQHNAWFSDGDYPRSIESLKVLHYMFPSDYGLVTDLGWMLENVHDDAGALVVYIEYAKSYPDDPEAAYPEAEYYFRNKLWAKVPPLLEPSLKLKEHPHANTYRILARSYEKLNLLTDSKRIWDLYLALAPTDGQAKVNRARVEKKLRPTSAILKGRDS